MGLSANSRVVLDTNVLISAFLWGGKPGTIIKKWRNSFFLLLISPFILGELANFLEISQIESKERGLIINELKTKSIKIIPSRKTNICRDKSDNKILDLCFSGRADFLVTGDKDLLVLKQYQSTKILTPTKFLKIF